MTTFADLDRAYDDAHRAWGEHVDHCSTCARSVFACPVGLALSGAMNAAWAAAKYVWDRMTAAEKEVHRP